VVEKLITQTVIIIDAYILIAKPSPYSKR
jgi:hypothetical protein